MPNSAAAPASVHPLPRLHSGVTEYERTIGPIAARKTTRVAALHAFTRSFWWFVWPDLKQRRVWGRAFGVIPVRVSLDTLRPVFTDLFGTTGQTTPPPAA
ncbi:MAG: hypothetical protein ACYC3L_01125 [Gemmatimonadaceae bacterium]